MNLISKFLSLFDGEFRGLLLGFITIMVISVGLQSLLLWLGDMCLDAILFALVLISIGQIVALKLSDLFPYKGTAGGGILAMFYICLGIIGVYVCIVHPALLGWNLLVGALLLIFLDWIFLEKIGADMVIVGIAVGIGLCYCLGTYFAMLLNCLEPVAEIPEVVIISLATLFAWFRTAFD